MRSIVTYRAVQSALTRVTAVAAGMALLCMGVMSGTAHAQGPGQGSQGNPTILDEIADFRERVEEINTALRDLINDRAQGIEDLIVGTHLVNPFDVAVDVCTEIGAGADYGVGLDLGLAANLEIKGGIDFFGNGATLKFQPQAELAGSASLGADVGVSVTACIAGIFARQNDSDPNAIAFQEDVASSLTDSEQIAFVEGLLQTGLTYRDRVIDTAKGANLFANSSDKLNTSLTAFEEITFADDPNSAVQQLFSGGFTSAIGGIDGLIGAVPLPGGSLFSGGLGVDFGNISPSDICGLLSTTGLLNDACSTLTDLQGFIDGVEDLAGGLSDIGTTLSDGFTAVGDAIANL